MKFTIGEKVFYPGRGPCLISAIVEKVVCGVSSSFYRLALLDDSGAEVFVPIDGLRGLNLRALLRRSDIPKVLGHLRPRQGIVKEPVAAKNWRQRELDNAKLFNSGSIFDLAGVVESLTQLSSTKTLAPYDRDTLYRAKRLLICEIAEVMEESKSAAAARIESVLESTRNKVNQLEA